MKPNLRLQVSRLVAILVVVVIAGCSGGKSGGGKDHTPGGLAPGVFQGKIIYSVGGTGSPLLGEGISSRSLVSGEAIANAKVEIEGLPFSAISDSSGNFKIQHIPPGQYKVSATKDTNNDGLPELAGNEILTMAAGQGTEQDVRATGTGSLSGRVTLAGAGTGNIGIMVFIPGTSTFAFTDDAGYYRMSGVPCPNAELTVAASKNCYSVEQVAVEVPNCGQEVEGVNFDLDYVGCPAPVPQTGGIRGSVFLLGQSSHSGILVSLHNGATTTTAGSGSYEFSGLATGVYQLTASAAGYSSASLNNITVQAGGTYLAPNLWLVNLADPDCDGDGIPNSLDPDDDNDGYPDTEEIAYGSNTCDAGSVPLGNISGSVFRFGTSDPLFGALVGVAGTDKVSITDASGQFSILEVHAGPKTLVAIMSGYSNGSTVVNVLSGQAVSATLYLSGSASNTPPTADITSPSNGVVVSQGLTLNFSGLVADAEDPPEELAVRWISSIDGRINSAAADLTGLAIFSTTQLSVGTHLITLRVTDSGRLSGEDHVAISVNPSTPPSTAALCVTPMSLDFGSTGSARTVQVSNCGSGTLTWSMTSNRTWLSATPGAGSLLAGEFTVVNLSVDRANLQFVTPYSGGLVIQSNGGNNLVAVQMFVPCGDRDGDGYNDAACGGNDCDDNDPNVHPGAIDICNGVDDDCDGVTDEDGNSSCNDAEPCNGEEFCNAQGQCESGPVQYCIMEPSELVALALSPSAIQLSWTVNSTGEEGQYLYRSTSDTGPFNQIDMLLPEVAGYIDSGLSQNTTYYYNVVSFKGTDISGPSNLASSQTLDLAAPQLSLTEGVNSFSLTWVEGDDFAVEYSLERAKVIAGVMVEPYAVIATLAAAADSYLDQDASLVRGPQYAYRLRSKDEANNYSAYSNVASGYLGQFSPVAFIDTYKPAFSVATADFNKDGNADFAYMTADNVFIFKGDGAGNFEYTGNFSQPELWSWYEVGVLYTGMMGGMKPALCLVGSPEYSRIDCQIPGYGGPAQACYFGGFPMGPQQCSSGGFSGGDEKFSANSSLIAQDINNDTYPDLVASNWLAIRVGYLSTQHGFMFCPSWPCQPYCWPGIYGCCCVDPDISTSGKCTNWTLSGGCADTGGDYRDTYGSDCCSAWTECNQVAQMLWEVTDCYPENPATMTYKVQNQVSYVRTGDFAFSAIGWDSAKGANELLVADFNSDNKQDILLPNDLVLEDYQDGAGFTYNFAVQPSSLSLFAGAGNGGFSAGASYDLDASLQKPATGFRLSSAASGDFDQDTELDAAVVNSAQNNLVLMRGVGDGTFSSYATITTKKGPMAVDAGNLDADGDIDLAVGYSDSCTQITIFWNDGAGNFPASTNLDTGIACDASKNRKPDIKIAQLNGDGIPDIVYVYPVAGGSKNVAIFWGAGSGSFSPADNYVVGNGAGSCWQTAKADVAVADFNNDGKPDLLIAISENQQLYFLYGK